MTTPKLSLSRMEESMCMYEYLPLEDQCNLLSWAKRLRDKFREYEASDDDDALMMLRYAELREIILEEFGE